MSPITICLIYNGFTHKDKKANSHVRVVAKHRLQEWLWWLPKENKAVSNPFILTPLCFFSPELTAVWDCTSSPMSTWRVCFLYALYKPKRDQMMTSAKCTWAEPLLPLGSRTTKLKKNNNNLTFLSKIPALSSSLCKCSSYFYTFHKNKLCFKYYCTAFTLKFMSTSNMCSALNV